MVNIRLPDGQEKQYPDGATAAEVLADIQSGAQKTPAPVGAKINGVPADLARPLDADGSVDPILPDSEDGLELIRHSAARAPFIGSTIPGRRICSGIPRAQRRLRWYTSCARLAVRDCKEGVGCLS